MPEINAIEAGAIQPGGRGGAKKGCWLGRAVRWVKNQCCKVVAKVVAVWNWIRGHDPSVQVPVEGNRPEREKPHVEVFSEHVKEIVEDVRLKFPLKEEDVDVDDFLKKTVEYQPAKMEENFAAMRKILQVERQIGEDKRTEFKEWCDQHRLFILTTMKQIKRQIQNQYAVIYVPEYLHLHNIFVKMELFSADRHCLSDEIIQLSRDCYGEMPLGFTNATGICCWMNATLQVLLNFPQVREKIRKRAGLIETSEEKYRSDFEAGIKLLERLKNKKTDENDKQKLMTQIEQKRKELDDQVRLEIRRDAVLARALLPLLAYPTDKSTVDAKTIKSFHDILFSSHLNFHNSQTAGNQQNDAHEGVNYILDRLDMKFPFVQESIPESGNIRERKTKTSALMIQDFKPTLQASIDNLFVEDKHNPKDPVAKSRRSQGRTVIKAKRFKIDGEPPELMVVHLNRVHYDEHANQFRYDKEMLFSNKTDEDLIFDFSAGFRDGKTHRYRLEAYTSQSGGVSGGHYTAYVHRGKEWYCANDSTVTKVSPPTKVDESFYSMVFKCVAENG